MAVWATGFLRAVRQVIEPRLEPELRPGLEPELGLGLGEGLGPGLWPEFGVGSGVRFNVVKGGKWRTEFVSGTVFGRRGINKKSDGINIGWRKKQSGLAPALNMSREGKGCLVMYKLIGPCDKLRIVRYRIVLFQTDHIVQPIYIYI